MCIAWAHPAGLHVHPVASFIDPPAHTSRNAGNKKKLEEVVAILEAGHPLPFAVQPAAVDLPELQVGG